MVSVPLLLIASGTRAAAALSAPAADEDDEPEAEAEAEAEDDEADAGLDALLGAPVVLPPPDAAGLLPLPHPAAVRASAIPAAPTMTALGVLPARMCSPPRGWSHPSPATFMGYGAGILAPAKCC
ncbi:hypothetical protein GCM10009838_31970 [Catenulispora subtropica]|uniref:Secreted protein n=1 Tax=Catenulispora subtropica TaxID=450798 RepID=A0ABP5CYV6_9ACTN